MYHIVSIALHCLVVLLLFIFLRKIFKNYMLTMIAENKNAKTDFQLAHIAYLDNELNYLLKNKYIYEL